MASNNNGYTDLGKMPMQPTSPMMAMSDSEDDGDAPEPKPYYPSICICTDKPLNLGKAGDVGECSIKYSVEECTERVKDDGSKEYRYELDVQGIKSNGKPSTPDMTASDSSEAPSSKGFKDAMSANMGAKSQK